jgi:hypothetical protein
LLGSSSGPAVGRSNAGGAKFRVSRICSDARFGHKAKLPYSMPREVPIKNLGVFDAWPPP